MAGNHYPYCMGKKIFSSHTAHTDVVVRISYCIDNKSFSTQNRKARTYNNRGHTTTTSQTLEAEALSYFHEYPVYL